MARLPLFATASRGTEPLLADELAALGAKRLRQDRGGVRFLADLDEILRVLVHSRLAMRVLYPLGTFEAPGADGLYEAARAVPWEDWLDRHTTFSVEATLKDTEHDHSGFVALKVKDGLVDRLRTAQGARPDVDASDPTFRVVAHLAGRTLSLSLDLAGEPLFKRGTRVSTTKAPLKETLAAAMLTWAGYDGSEPLADPLCGSGTLLTEAAMIAADRAPGLGRSFALERWPRFAAKARPLLDDIRAAARARVRAPPCPIIGRDRDEDAVAAARRNLRALKLGPAVTVDVADVLSTPPPEGEAGLVVTNPPYGERLALGGQKGMKTFFFSLSEALARWQGWRVVVLAGNPAFESAFHRRPAGRMTLWNGPIACTLLTYATPRAPRSRLLGGPSEG